MGVTHYLDGTLQENLHGWFDAGLEPRVTVEPGDRVVYRTADAMWDRDAPTPGQTVRVLRGRREPVTPLQDRCGSRADPRPFASWSPLPHRCVRVAGSNRPTTPPREYVRLQGSEHLAAVCCRVRIGGCRLRAGTRARLIRAASEGPGARRARQPHTVCAALVSKRTCTGCGIVIIIAKTPHAVFREPSLDAPGGRKR
jgi:hypothetical protein